MAGYQQTHYDQNYDTGWPQDDGYSAAEHMGGQYNTPPNHGSADDYNQANWHGGGGDHDFDYGQSYGGSENRGAKSYMENWEANALDGVDASKQVQKGMSRGVFKPKIEYGEFFYMCLNVDGAPMFADCNSNAGEVGRAQLGEVIPCDARARPGKDGLRYVRGFKAEWILETGKVPGTDQKVPILEEVNTSGSKNAELKNRQFCTVQTVPCFHDPCVYLPVQTTIPGGTFVKVTEFLQYHATNGMEVIMYHLDKRVGPCVDGWIPLKLPGNLVALTDTNLKHVDPPQHFVCMMKEGVGSRWGPTADPTQLVHEAKPLQMGTLVETDTIVRHKITHEEYAQVWQPAINNYAWFPVKLYVEANHSLHELLRTCEYRVEWWQYKVVEDHCVGSYQSPVFTSQRLQGPFQKNTRLICCEIIDMGIVKKQRQGCWVKLAPPLAGWVPCFNPTNTKRLLMPLGQTASGKAEFAGMLKNFHNDGGNPGDVMKKLKSTMATQMERNERKNKFKVESHDRAKAEKASKNKGKKELKAERNDEDKKFLTSHGY
mmetsp:Transcript_2007/g.4666  ORF Transcript_2007/g.4666 Transcript_2007/m.4666 type:complete len:543 (+) Transcript_2007:360-1988(+)|eukprot:CAMPEP_0178982050 /NCGR_PEP_ID=MMETSP0795-20121207/285_1 /TAXON_ID=88552 /ORGANISM="Amoebophrya sp., Strain Ameob2" /LENGTH=542 /DNA_ID=CAMNT_0020672661 /DNA_START=317 /DNA_END=1945 /DNA_ORIENTATION=-